MLPVHCEFLLSTILQEGRPWSWYDIWISYVDIIYLCTAYHFHVLVWSWYKAWWNGYQFHVPLNGESKQKQLRCNFSHTEFKSYRDTFGLHLIWNLLLPGLLSHLKFAQCLREQSSKSMPLFSQHQHPCYPDIFLYCWTELSFDLTFFIP